MDTKADEWTPEKVARLSAHERLVQADHEIWEANARIRELVVELNKQNDKLKRACEKRAEQVQFLESHGEKVE